MNEILNINCIFHFCPGKLKSIDAYCKHVNKHIPRSESERIIQFQCPLCVSMKKIFLNVGSLKLHMKKQHPIYLEPSTTVNIDSASDLISAGQETPELILPRSSSNDTSIEMSTSPNNSFNTRPLKGR